MPYPRVGVFFCIPTRSRYSVLVNTGWPSFQELEYNEIWLMQNLPKFNDPWVNCCSFYNLKYFMFFRNFGSWSLLEITCLSLCQILQDDILNTILSFFWHAFLVPRDWEAECYIHFSDLVKPAFHKWSGFCQPSASIRQGRWIWT